MTQIATLSIGTELLKGSTINTNASFIGQELRTAGYMMNETLVVHDVPSQMRKAFDFLLADHDVVITTGGLGPTTDDLTKDILMEHFGGELVRHEPTWDNIRAIFQKFGRKVNPSNERQAMVPTSARVMMNPIGTAPGLHFEKDGKHLFALPGVPFEMKNLISTEVLPFLLEKFPPGFQASDMIRSFGITESAAAEKMKVLWPNLPRTVEFAYLPGYDGLRVEMTVRGPEDEAEALKKDLQTAKERIAESFKNYIYALEDTTLEEVLGKELKLNEKTIATAESMTGGTIAQKIVSVSGASKYFLGSVVAYHTDVKVNVLGVPAQTIEERGLVSSETAREMAEGVRKLLKADIGLATTGNAEENPTDPHFQEKGVWIGVSWEGGGFSEFYPLFHRRDTNIQRGANAALAFALKAVKEMSSTKA